MNTSPDSTVEPRAGGQALGWLRTMLLIRRFEERAEQLTVRGRSPAGFTLRWARRPPPWVSPPL